MRMCRDPAAVTWHQQKCRAARAAERRPVCTRTDRVPRDDEAQGVGRSQAVELVEPEAEVANHRPYLPPLLALELVAPRDHGGEGAKSDHVLGEQRSSALEIDRSYAGLHFNKEVTRDVGQIGGGHRVLCIRSGTVTRPPGTQTVYLTFEGLRDSRTIADKLARVRVALPASEARRLVELLATLEPNDDHLRG